MFLIPNEKRCPPPLLANIVARFGVSNAATAETATKGFTFSLLAVVIATNNGKKYNGASPTK